MTRRLASLLVAAALVASLPTRASQPEKVDPMTLPKELPPLAPDRPLPVPAVVSRTLPNGLVLWTVRQPDVPLATVRLVVRGGASDDAPGSPGLSGLLASALKEGTATRTGAQLAALAQEAGGEVETAAGSDSVVVGASGLASKVPLLLDLVADVATRPSFPEAGVARVKALAHEELETNEAEPFFLARRAFLASVYGGHPYGTVAPTAASIDGVTRALLAAETGRRLRPERSLLVVVGDVDPAAVGAEAARFLGGWKGTGEAPAAPADAAPPAGPRRIELLARPGSVQTVLVAGTLGLARKDPDAYPLDLAMAIYGGAFTSRLVQNLREEKGYTYSPGAASTWLAHRGVVLTYAAVRNEVTGAAFNEILYEMERMATTDPTDEEMDRARRRNVGAQAIALQTNGGLAEELGRLWVLGLPPAEIGRTVEALGRVTKADVRRVCRRYLASGAARIVAVGDPAVVRDELSSFGPVVEAKAAR